ncbi:MAG: hypothetical protein V5B32_10460 [Candidatus Accumulibacter sp. UW26]|jgi:hypothetical protein
MHVSAEIRWFWREQPPEGFKDWFLSIVVHEVMVGGGSTRVDRYLIDPEQSELGLKARGGKTGIEVKGLVAVAPDGLNTPPFAGPIELWGKWTSEALQFGSLSTRSLEKQRWLRTFDTALASPVEIPLDSEDQPLDGHILPTQGCNVELVRIRLLPKGDTWWTYAFEAFGALESVANSLRMVASVIADRQPPPLGRPLVASYPAWLGERSPAPRQGQ